MSMSLSMSEIVKDCQRLLETFKEKKTKSKTDVEEVKENGTTTKSGIDRGSRGLQEE